MTKEKLFETLRKAVKIRFNMETDVPLDAFKKSVQSFFRKFQKKKPKPAANGAEYDQDEDDENDDE